MSHRAAPSRFFSPPLLLASVCGALLLAGCGGSPDTAGANSPAQNKSRAQQTSGEDIREKVAPFYNEQYMKVSDRFKLRRERLLKALAAK
jgi:hypothetical protein